MLFGAVQSTDMQWVGKTWKEISIELKKLMKKADKKADENMICDLAVKQSFWGLKVENHIAGKEWQVLSADNEGNLTCNTQLSFSRRK